MVFQKSQNRIKKSQFIREGEHQHQNQCTSPHHSLIQQFPKSYSEDGFMLSAGGAWGREGCPTALQQLWCCRHSGDSYWAGGLCWSLEGFGKPSMLKKLWAGSECSSGFCIKTISAHQSQIRVILSIEEAHYRGHRLPKLLGRVWLVRPPPSSGKNPQVPAALLSTHYWATPFKGERPSNSSQWWVATHILGTTGLELCPTIPVHRSFSRVLWQQLDKGMNVG